MKGISFHQWNCHLRIKSAQCTAVVITVQLLQVWHTSTRKCFHDPAVEDGKLYTWGWNKFGQCGVGSMEENIPQPRLVERLLDYRVIKVGLGEQHTIVLVEPRASGSW